MYTSPVLAGDKQDCKQIFTYESNPTCRTEAVSKALAGQFEGLSDYSPRDTPWDIHRGQTDDVAGIYEASTEFERYAVRMASCSGRLQFGWDTCKESGESSLKLREAHFCRVRHCPTCQWRRSLMWQARFYQALPDIVQANPKARWIFLTLTVRNCEITELGDTLAHMNKSFQRLKERKEFKPVLGWIRTTEVTKGKDGSAHPHFHALLMVPPSWFTRDYVKHSRWVDLWADCLRVHYPPNVDVRAVKTKTPKGDQTLVINSTIEALRGAVAETLKYSTKPSDMTDSDDSDGWFLELTRQTHKRRFIATGGALKDVLKVDDESDEDMALTDGEGTDEGPRLSFDWKTTKRRFMRNRKADQNT
jgi:plasmid rolling circle replication initiator protein Rep